MNIKSVSKHLGDRTLFEEISFMVHPREHIGLIGPNGAGKSTLMKILANLVDVDDGQVETSRGCRVGYLAQTEDFDQSHTLVEAVVAQMGAENVDLMQKQVDAAIALDKMGFTDQNALVGSLSGGWQKRLALAAQLAMKPDVLLLDEPTNHLDMEAIMWLEQFLKKQSFSTIIISHDRSFLQNACNRVMELNPRFPEGIFSADAPYDTFLERRKIFIEAEMTRMESLKSKARREDAWLKQGIKARGTRQRARVEEAGRIFEELSAMKARTVTPKRVDLKFQDTERKTKRLIVAHGLEKSFGEKQIVKGLDLTLTPKMRLGLVGSNGSGKTTLMKMLAGEIEPDSGSVKTISDLRVVYFDQSRQLLDKTVSLRDALSPTGTDGVVYQDRLLHVASWAKQLRFRSDQLETPVGKLSGGEQARVLLGQLMLQPADVLFLDEPTNDLDIPTLEMLEEMLTDFPGAVVLVTHDRAMLDRVSTILLGLDGSGKVHAYASCEQWEREQGASPNQEKETSKPATKDAGKEASKPANQPAKKVKLSYKEQREFDGMEEAILEAEEALEAMVQNPIATGAGQAYSSYCMALSEAQMKVEKLYARWSELESKQKGEL